MASVSKTIVLLAFVPFIFLENVTYKTKIYPKNKILEESDNIPEEKIKEWELRNLIKKIETPDKKPEGSGDKKLEA